MNRLDFTSVSFSRPARPAACRRLTENTSRDPEERSEGRTEGRKESTIHVETQRNSPHLRLRLPVSATITKIIGDSYPRQTTISNRFFFFSFLGCLIYLLCSFAPIFIERSSIEKVMSFVYELKKSKSNQTHGSIFPAMNFSEDVSRDFIVE